MLRKYSFSLFLLPLSFLLRDSSLQTDNTLRTGVDSIVHTAASVYMASPYVKDLSIGLFRNGVSYTYNYHKGAGKLPGAGSYYGIGSIAKTFVTTVLAQAIIEKKIKPEDDIRRYLPGKYPNLEYKGHPVRVRDLASHTSALPELSRPYTDQYIDSISKLPPAQFSDWYNVYTADSLLKDMHQFQLDTIPGTRYRYNGNAMMVLTVLLEQVYHQPYEIILRNYLQKHHGMQQTKLVLSATEKKKFMQGHDDKGNALPYILDKGFRAAPSLISTVSDMLKFIQANLEEKQQAMKLAHQPVFAEMGLGWMIGKTEQGWKYIMHAGHDGAGFNALCYMYPEKQTGIIIMVNESTGQDRVAALQRAISAGLFLKLL